MYLIGVAFAAYLTGGQSNERLNIRIRWEVWLFGRWRHASDLFRCLYSLGDWFGLYAIALVFDRTWRPSVHFRMDALEARLVGPRLKTPSRNIRSRAQTFSQTRQ